MRVDRFLLALLGITTTFADGLAQPTASQGAAFEANVKCFKDSVHLFDDRISPANVVAEAVGIDADWGTGFEGFLSTVLENHMAQSATYRLDLSEYSGGSIEVPSWSGTCRSNAAVARPQIFSHPGSLQAPRTGEAFSTGEPVLSLSSFHRLPEPCRTCGRRRAA